MNPKVNNTNHHTRQLSVIDLYLLRIIKRYFGIEELKNDKDIQAIIYEAMSRYKASLSYEASEVLSFNNMTGAIEVNIQNFNGELSFEKNTAFNKNFGNKIDTIVNGNDNRLKNSRAPKQHTHTILEINLLIDEIESLLKKMVLYANHIHTNQNILNKIKYTSRAAQIDLTKVENITYVLSSMLGVLDIQIASLEQIYQEQQEVLNNVINELYFLIQETYDSIFKAKDVLKYDLIENVDSVMPNKKESIDKILLSYVNNDMMDNIYEFHNESYSYVDSYTLPIIDIFDTGGDGMSNIDTKYMKDIYDSSYCIGLVDDVYKAYHGAEKEALWSFDETKNTFICNVNQVEFLMFLSNIKLSKYKHAVTLSSPVSDNDMISIILASYRDGEVYDILYTLSLNITTGLDEYLNTQYNFSVVYGYQTEMHNIVAYDDTLSVDSTWNLFPEGIRVIIERDNNVFKIYRSDFNKPNQISSTPCIEFDMSDFDFMETIIDVPSEYGYGCMGQQGAQFTDITLEGNLDIILENNIIKTLDILPSNVSTDTMYIKTELINGNSITPMPFIYNDFIIEAGIQNKLLYAKLSLFYTETSTDKIFNNIRYLVIEKSMNYDDASEYCKTIGGVLAQSKDKATDDFLTELIQGSSYNMFWLGASNHFDDEIWRWNDETEIVYTNWDSSVLDNPEMYLIKSNEKNGKWINANAYMIDENDDPICDGFICQIINPIMTSEIPKDILLSNIRYSVYAKNNN